MVQSCKESNESQSLLEHSHNHFTYGSEQTVSDVPKPTILQENSNKKPSHHMQHSVHEDPSSHSSLRSVILVLALSLHAIFEGFAIGLETTQDDVISLLTAVMIHKSILAFTLGLNLVQSKLPQKIIIACNFTFSIVAPIGMAIGIGIMNLVKGASLSLVSGILQSIATGTFIYVTFFEVLPHELHNNADRMIKLFWIIIGYSSFAFITYYMPS